MANFQTAQPLPNPYSNDDRNRMEEALRIIGSQAKPMIERCKRCNIPVGGAEQDCADLERFLTSVLEEFFGQGSPQPLGR